MGSPETMPVRHAKHRRGMPVLQGLIWVVAAALGFGIVLSQTFVAQLEGRIDTHDVAPLLGDDRPPPALPPADGSQGRALNILLMGSDDRSGANAAIGGEESGQRSDTTIIMHISADRTRVELLSIPRDSMVRLAECERSDGSTQRSYTGMFNDAFANGGKDGSKAHAAGCTWNTVESLTNIRLDHWAIVDFVGFQAMIDAVDGVPMCIPHDIKDRYTGLDLKAGPQVMDGYTATQYARMRKGTGLSGSDLDRIDRQQQLLKNLARKVIGTEVLFSPTSLVSFIAAAAQSVAMDEQLGNIDGYTAGLAYSLRGLDSEAGIVMATVPVQAYPPDPKNRVEFAPGAAAVFAALAADQPMAPLLDNASSSPANEPDVGVAPAPTATPGAEPPPAETEAEILAACTA